MHACVRYLRVCSFPLFLLLAQGTCSSRPWDLPGLRLSSAFKVPWHPPAPSSHGARCGVCRGQLSPAALRARDWRVAPCSLTAVRGGGGGRISSRAQERAGWNHARSLQWKRRACLERASAPFDTALPGAFQVLLCSWPHVSRVLMPTLVGIAMGVPMLGLAPGAKRKLR